MSETIWTPLIVSASIDPSPSTVGQPVVLRVVVIDVFGGEQEEARYSGEFYAGEV